MGAPFLKKLDIRVFKVSVCYLMIFSPPEPISQKLNLSLIRAYIDQYVYITDIE